MAFNPLAERGTPIEKQFKTWRDLNVKPYDKRSIHPYSRTRVILMNGVELESVWFSHQFARHCDHPEVKAQLALTRRIEQQQQKTINWLNPANQSPLETTIGYEQTAIDLTAFLARSEPDPYIKQTFDFGLLEDFDHLYRYANLLDLAEGKDAKDLLGDLTEIMPGRPTALEHRHPYDDVRAHYDTHTVDPLSRLHVLTLLAGEQQTMNFYNNVGPLYEDPIARGLYQEIAMIEEQHVTQYESLLDPVESWFQQWVFHEYNECYLYYFFMQQEPDARIKGIWEEHLHMELEHLRIACDLMRKLEGTEPEEILPKELPEPTRFESNKAYIRQVLQEQLDLRTMGPEFLLLERLPQDALYFQHLRAVNGEDRQVPSEQVIRDHQDRKGFTIQLLTEGPAPVSASGSPESPR